MTLLSGVRATVSASSDVVTSTEMPQTCKVEGLYYPGSDGVCPTGAVLTITPSPAVVNYPEQFTATIPASETTQLPQCGYTDATLTTKYCYPLPEKYVQTGWQTVCVPLGTTPPTSSCYLEAVYAWVTEPWNSVPHNVSWNSTASTLTFYEPQTTDTCYPVEQFSTENFGLSSGQQPCYTTTLDSFTATHVYATAASYDPTLGVEWNGSLPYTLDQPQTNPISYECGYTSPPPAYLGIGSCLSSTPYTSASINIWTATSVQTQQTAFHQHVSSSTSQSYYALPAGQTTPESFAHNLCPQGYPYSGYSTPGAWLSAMSAIAQAAGQPAYGGVGSAASCTDNGIVDPPDGPWAVNIAYGQNPNPRTVQTASCACGGPSISGQTSSTGGTVTYYPMPSPSSQAIGSPAAVPGQTYLKLVSISNGQTYTQYTLHPDTLLTQPTYARETFTPNVGENQATYFASTCPDINNLLDPVDHVGGSVGNPFISACQPNYNVSAEYMVFSPGTASGTEATLIPKTATSYTENTVSPGQEYQTLTNETTTYTRGNIVNNGPKVPGSYTDNPAQWYYYVGVGQGGCDHWSPFQCSTIEYISYSGSSYWQPQRVQNTQDKTSSHFQVNTYYQPYNQLGGSSTVHFSVASSASRPWSDVTYTLETPPLMAVHPVEVVSAPLVVDQVEPVG